MKSRRDFLKMAGAGLASLFGWRVSATTPKPRLVTIMGRSIGRETGEVLERQDTIRWIDQRISNSSGKDMVATFPCAETTWTHGEIVPDRKTLVESEVSRKTYWVDWSDDGPGDDANDGLSPETAWATTQRAIDEAEAGSVILAPENRTFTHEFTYKPTCVGI